MGYISTWVADPLNCLLNVLLNNYLAENVYFKTLCDYNEERISSVVMVVDEVGHFIALIVSFSTGLI